MDEKKLTEILPADQDNRARKNAGARLGIGRNVRYRVEDLTDWLRSLEGDA